MSELLEHYDQVLIAMGAPGSRELGIPGEHLLGSLSAPEFVGWYNGHPDFRDLEPPLDERTAVIVGMGNVAIDVARVLLRERAVLEATDIAHYAREALQRSAVSEVILLARRGPDEAAFDVKEVRELLGVSDVDVRVAGLGPSPRTDKGKLMAELPRADVTMKRRRIVFRFCVSPKEIIGENGRMIQLRVEDNDLVESAARVRAVGSGRTEVIEAGLCIRAIGYRGAALPGVPFEDASSTIPSDRGAVLTRPSGDRVPQLYVTGWIKRGPTGLIGTNKACAQETVETMQAHLRHIGPSREPDLLLGELRARGVRIIDWKEWQHLDAWERARGSARGAPREKLVSLEDVLSVLEQDLRAEAAT